MPANCDKNCRNDRGAAEQGSRERRNATATARRRGEHGLREWPRTAEQARLAGMARSPRFTTPEQPTPQNASTHRPGTRAAAPKFDEPTAITS
jgi:hypothetical protein